MLSNSVLPFNFKFSGEDVTSTGGVALFLHLLAQHRLLRDLPGDRQRRQGWLEGQMILAAMLLNLFGYDHVEDVARLEADRALCALVRRSELVLFGQRAATIERRFRNGRRRCFPSPRSMHDWLARFHDAAAAQERVAGEAYIPVPAPAFASQRELAKRMIACLVAQKGIEELTIDIDATIIASGKREAAHTYRSVTGGLAPGETGYQPIVAYCPELDLTLGAEMRDGNVPALMDVPRFFRETLGMLPAQVTKVTLRTDCAGYQEELFKFCLRPCERSVPLQRFGVIGFITGAPVTKSVRERVAELPEAAWMVAEGGSHYALAELGHVPDMAVRLRKHEDIRFVVTRREVHRLEVDPDDVTRTCSRGCRRTFKLRLVATTLPCAEMKGALPAASAAEVIGQANQRCGAGEDVHRVVKHELSGGMMPSGLFGANAAWFWLSVHAYNLVAMARHLAFGGEKWLRVRLKRVRAVFLYQAGRFVCHANRKTLVLPRQGSSELRTALCKIGACVPP